MNGIVRPHVEEYITSLAPPRDALLEELEHEAQQERIPICGPLVGALLHILIAAQRPRIALELGTAIGYSAVWMGRALRAHGGRLITIELDPSRTERARANLRRAGLADVVEVTIGTALDVLPAMSGPMDFIFIDAVKSEYPDYLTHAARLLRPGGVLVADNVLQRGGVADPALASGRSPAAIDAIRRFNETLFAHRSFVSTILPLRDGLTLSVRL